MKDEINLMQVCLLTILFLIQLILFNVTFTRKKYLDLLISALLSVGLTYFFYFQFYLTSISLLIPIGLNFLLASVSIFFSRKEVKKKGEIIEKPFVMEGKNSRDKIVFFNPYRHYMGLGGTGSGKTKSIGKNLLLNYIKNGFAGFIYDLKDFDYTKTALFCCKKFNYPYDFFYLNFEDVSRSYRTNPINPKLMDEGSCLQLAEDLFSAYKREGKKDEWYTFAVGVFKGVLTRFFMDFPEHCNIPTVTNFCVQNDAKRIIEFVSARAESRGLASSLINAEGSANTQNSILASLTGPIADLAVNKKIAYVLSGDDFDFNIIDPQRPKLIALSNSYQMMDILGPIVGLMIQSATRKFVMGNKIKAVVFLDEATTFKIQGLKDMLSVLREYLCSFVILTQSTVKIENMYGKGVKNDILSNISNVFYGATTDITGIKDFSLLFSKRKEDRKTRTSGSTGDRSSRSISTTIEEKPRYEPDFFRRLEPGRFIGFTQEASVPEFDMKFKMWEEDDNIEIPIVRTVTNADLENNYQRIIHLVKSIV